MPNISRTAELIQSLDIHGQSKLKWPILGRVSLKSEVGSEGCSFYQMETNTPNSNDSYIRVIEQCK
jgi:hypothetical protein